MNSIQQFFGSKKITFYSTANLHYVVKSAFASKIGEYVYVLLERQMNGKDLVLSKFHYGEGLGGRNILLYEVGDIFRLDTLWSFTSNEDIKKKMWSKWKKDGFIPESPEGNWIKITILEIRYV